MHCIEYFAHIILSYVLWIVQWDVRIIAVYGLGLFWHAQKAYPLNDPPCRSRLLRPATADNQVSAVASCAGIER